MTPMTHAVRPATLDDVGFLAEVVVSATRDQGRLPEDFDEADYRSGFAEWTAEQVVDTGSDSTTSVITVDGERIGRLRVVRSPGSLELAGLQLLPAWQSRGIGSAVVRDLVAESSESGRVLTLGVELDNPSARALYLRLGFVDTGVRDGETLMTYRGSDSQ